MEGLNRNIFNLKHFLDIHHPDLVFLSEPQTHSCNLDLVAKPLAGSYNYSLNTADKFDPDLPLLKAKAHGGTMILWRSELDPFISVHPVSSTSFLPIIFHPPGSLKSIHIAVYLPTMGLESKFMEELSKLSITVDELTNANPGAPIYLRGDFNVSKNNQRRTDLLEHFCSENFFLQVELSKPTYHHFLGAGKSDSYLDRILFSESLQHPESVSSIECKLENPLVDSHHDILVTRFILPTVSEEVADTKDHKVAPVIPNNRLKVVWTDEGIEDFQKLVAPELSRIQNLWLSTPTRTSMSLLLESTNNILISCASSTNRTISLKNTSLPSKPKTPAPIMKSQRALLKQFKELRRQSSKLDNQGKVDALKEKHKKSRDEHRKLICAFKATDSSKRDEDLYSIVSGDPAKLFNSIRRSKRSKAEKISKLCVGDKQ